VCDRRSIRARVRVRTCTRSPSTVPVSPHCCVAHRLVEQRWVLIVSVNGAIYHIVPRSVPIGAVTCAA
jgi:hypothetical protein